MRRVPIALGAGLLLTLLALLVVLSRAPLTLAGSNEINSRREVAKTWGEVTLCEKGGTLPKGTVAIRVSLSANVGPAVTVKAIAGKKVVAQGSRPAGWGLAETATVNVKPVSRAYQHVRICTVVGAGAEPLELKGTIVEHVVALRVEYLRVGPSSWFSLAPSVAAHMGLGRAPTGTWIAWGAVVVMLAATALAARTALRELR
jgi:hypothetical protein